MKHGGARGGGNFSIRIAEKGNEHESFLRWQEFPSRVYSSEKSREKGSLFRETFTAPRARGICK